MKLKKIKRKFKRTTISEIIKTNVSLFLKRIGIKNSPNVKIHTYTRRCENYLVTTPYATTADFISNRCK